MAIDTKKITLSSYVGFDNITKQIQSKLTKRGFSFNLMIIGRSGLGKSTMVNTLFAAHYIDSKGNKDQTTEITTVTNLIEENGVKLKLSITDTPGFGDLVNNEGCWEPSIKYIKDQYSLYLRKELTPQRDARIEDTRVHAVLYFISPTGHSLSPLDITVLKKISKVANIIPVIAKSDSLTPEELAGFKKRIIIEIDFHGIKLYPTTDLDEEYNVPGSDEDRASKQVINQLRVLFLFKIRQLFHLLLLDLNERS
jgi:septin 3/9/12